VDGMHNLMNSFSVLQKKNGKKEEANMSPYLAHSIDNVGS
jgi:hypothetical protein